MLSTIFVQLLGQKMVLSVIQKTNMKYLFFVLALFVSGTLMAQSVAVHKDPRIEILIKKQAEINNASTRNSAKRRSSKGFRLLIANTSSRTDAMAARTKSLTYFPELKPYLVHQAPYFKITVGNFLTRAEAAAYQKRMASLFPGGIFIVNATIEVKPEEVEKE